MENSICTDNPVHTLVSMHGQPELVAELPLELPLYIHIYTVISLLAMFRLEDMGVSRFKRVVSTQSTAKMYKVCSELGLLVCL